MEKARNEKLKDLASRKCYLLIGICALGSVRWGVWICGRMTRGAGFIPSGLRKSVSAVGWKIWIGEGGGERNAERSRAGEGRRQRICSVSVCDWSVPGWRVARYLVSHDCLWGQTKTNKKTHSDTHYTSWGLPSLWWLIGHSPGLPHPSLLCSIYYIGDYIFSCPFPVITHLSNFKTLIFKFVSDSHSKDEGINYRRLEKSM